jgi:hypothetical protein
MNGFEVRDSGPGFLSLAIAELRENQDLAREIQDRFSAVRGIQQLEVDLTEGWLTVFFNYRQLTPVFPPGPPGGLQVGFSGSEGGRTGLTAECESAK